MRQPKVGDILYSTTMEMYYKIVGEGVNHSNVPYLQIQFGGDPSSIKVSKKGIYEDIKSGEDRYATVKEWLAIQVRL